MGTIQNMACVWIFSTEIPFSLQLTKLSFHEATNTWQACRKCRTCNLGKIKYGVLVRMVCVAVLGFISKMKIYTAKGQNLEDRDSSLLDRNLGQNHNIYQATFIIIWDQLKHCWQKGRVVALWGPARGIPPDLEHEANHMSTGQSLFQREGEVIVQVWRQKTCANEKDDPWCNCSECRKERQNTLGNKEPHTVFQCNTFMKGVDRADKYLSSQIWGKLLNGQMYLLNCTPFNAFLCAKH